MIGMKIQGYANGLPTGVDGRWVRTYRPHMAPDSTGWLDTTEDPAEALGFDHLTDAIEVWRQSIGTRPDGAPNRPLTALNIEFVQLPGR